MGWVVFRYLSVFFFMVFVFFGGFVKGSMGVFFFKLWLGFVLCFIWFVVGLFVFCSVFCMRFGVCVLVIMVCIVFFCLICLFVLLFFFCLFVLSVFFCLLIVCFYFIDCFFCFFFWYFWFGFKVGFYFVLLIWCFVSFVGVWSLRFVGDVVFVIFVFRGCWVC